MQTVKEKHAYLRQMPRDQLEFHAIAFANAMHEMSGALMICWNKHKELLPDA